MHLFCLRISCGFDRADLAQGFRGVSQSLHQLVDELISRRRVFVFRVNRHGRANLLPNPNLILAAFLSQLLNLQSRVGEFVLQVQHLLAQARVVLHKLAHRVCVLLARVSQSLQRSLLPRAFCICI